MNDSNQNVDLQRQIAEHQAAAARLTHQLQQGSLLSPVSATFDHGQINDHKLAMRSHSTMGHPSAAPMMAQRSYDDRAAFKRQRRALSQQAAQDMHRNISNRSETGMPFRQTGPIQPLLAPSRSLPNIEQGASMRSLSQGMPTMPDVGMTPDAFLAQSFGDANSYLDSTGVGLSPIDIMAAQSGSKCPSMVSGWSAGDGLTPMTRQNSFLGEHLGADMSRFSSESHSSGGYVDGSVFMGPNNNCKRPYADQDILGVGANYGSDMSLSPVQMQNPYTLSPDVSADASAMERSASNTSSSSTRSSASTKRRNKEALDRVIRAGQVTVLRPKPLPTVAKPAQGTVPSKPDNKVAVPKKTTYQRRKPVKVFCNQCDEHPDGFRGDHELRRHTSAKHEGVVKKFICRDPALVGLQTDLVAAKPLSACKQCNAQKQYGAYYNAAAHLRRQHFNPRVARGKGSSDEKRGGKGGGDWPPMAELKAWFEERYVTDDQKMGLDAESEECDAEATVVDQEFDLDMFSGMHGTMAPFEFNSLGDSPIMGMPGNMPTSAPFNMDYSEGVAMHGMLPSFSEGSVQPYGSPYSSANTLTPTSYQGMSRMSINDGNWEVAM